jgi:hypothetical protein
MRYIHIVGELHSDDKGRYLLINDTGKAVKIYDMIDLVMYICKFFKGMQ